MKKMLLIIILALPGTLLWGQSKTTGTVNLLTGMTAQLDLDSATSTVTLTFTGPSDRWFALQFGSFSTGGGMQAGQDVVYYNGTTLVDAVHNGIGVTPSTDAINDWTVTSNTVSGSTRTIVATRAFNTTHPGDYTFVYSDTTIDFAFSHYGSASYVLGYHGANRGYAINVPLTCMAPDAPTASAQTFCSGATVADLSVNAATGATIHWYTNATGGSALASTTALSSGTYYVSQTLSECESSRQPVAVTVTVVPAPVAPAAQSFCFGGMVSDLQATAAGGAALNWYASATGGTPLAANAELSEGTYYAGQMMGDCTSQRTPVAVTFITLDAPPATTSQTFCNGATVAELETGVSGPAEAVVYASLAGQPIGEGETLVTGTYYITQSESGCESDATAVSVTVNVIPSAPAGADVQEFDAGDTIADLNVTTDAGATVTWYTFDGSVYTEVNASTALMDGMTYYCTQSVNGCESDYKAVTANQALGTQAFGLEKLMVYPNPVGNELTISNKSALSQVVLMNLLGQKIITVHTTENIVKLNTGKLPAGNYIIKVYSEKGTCASLKVIKR